MSTLHINQTVTLSLLATDATGITVPFKPDGAPVWTNSNQAAATMVVGADGLTAVITPVTVGTVTSVTVGLVISGVTFTASDDISVIDGTIASVSIVETFSPLPAAARK